MSKVTGHTALTRACILGRLETAEVLLDRGADVNRFQRLRRVNGNAITAASGLGKTSLLPCRPPLVMAAAAGHADMVRLLLERGADLFLRDSAGKTAGDVARDGGFVDVLAELAKVTKPKSKHARRQVPVHASIADTHVCD